MHDTLESIQYSEEYYAIFADSGNKFARKRIDTDFIETIGSYEYDLNNDDIPEIIKVSINIPHNSLITCKFSSGELEFQREDGHWFYDKILWVKNGGEKTFNQRTTDGTWWID